FGGVPCVLRIRLISSLRPNDQCSPTFKSGFHRILSCPVGCRSFRRFSCCVLLWLVEEQFRRHFSQESRE
ncbi:hypothetical protein PFISCL1PPCAC_14242, partial [Pristionchus fissidentatus]